MSDTATPSNNPYEAQVQAQHSFELVAIRNLFNDRELYENLPDFQREYVWPEKFRRAMIDSILRGYPIHPLLCSKIVGEDGAEKYQVIDGHQRLSTIYEFLEGQFGTATIAENRRDEPSSLPPIEPGKRYQELPERAKNIFNAYKFSINILVDVNDDAKRTIFRRVQHQLPLTMAEKLASYTSQAANYARHLREHALWTQSPDFYIGQDRRKETFEGSLFLLMLELTQDYTSLTSSQLYNLAAGSKDKLITQKLFEDVESRLDVMMHAFAGCTFKHRKELIPMYQAIIFLEKHGHVFTASDRGCLTPWFGQVLFEANREERHGFAYPLNKIVEINQQRDFWYVNLARIIEQCNEKPDSAA